ncbi:flavin-containing monooxygenase [Longibacter salinarum]|uniref:flavin-containing monooxygenase n=1 Tax=Longibacter salinarum TaxID=1850348 RepID=UPI001FE7A930|nr:NAD(P)-binding domain-containing protein [Longibacter salinarum]
MARRCLLKGQKACIIGAGISGLTAAKALSDRGLLYDHFELGSDIGGLWRFENDNRRSAAYRTLHINSSKHNMELDDFPMPDDFPVFGHHADVLQYFEDYADSFDLRESITFNTGVEQVERDGRNRWTVTLTTGERRTYGAVIVATGHHWNPRWPDFPGSFAGEELHSHDYTEPRDFLGKRVLVVGIGNSACDIVVDLSRMADHVTLSTRSSAWILPKYILGQPLDQWTNPYMERLPVSVRRLLFKLLVWISVGDQETYGLPKPDHDLMEEHPTISQELLSQIGHGRVEVKPNIDRLDGDSVSFEDGTSEAYDAVIYATGYDITFPFLPDDLFSVEENQVRLFRYIVPPNTPGLYFLGLIQPLGALMPLVEKQSKWVAMLLDGAAILPEPDAMEEAIDDELKAMRKRYTGSPRHTIQVDFWNYMRQIEREMRRGKKRAQREGPAHTMNRGEPVEAS